MFSGVISNHRCCWPADHHGSQRTDPGEHQDAPLSDGLHDAASTMWKLQTPLCSLIQTWQFGEVARTTPGEDPGEWCARASRWQWPTAAQKADQSFQQLRQPTEWGANAALVIQRIGFVINDIGAPCTFLIGLVSQVADFPESSMLQAKRMLYHLTYIWGQGITFLGIISWRHNNNDLWYLYSTVLQGNYSTWQTASKSDLEHGSQADEEELSSHFKIRNLHADMMF